MLSLIFVIAVAGILVKVRNHINAAVCIAACVFAEVIIIPRQDSIQNNACDCRNGEGGQCDICVGNIEGQSIGEAQTADKNHTCDNQIARFCEIYAVFYRYAHRLRKSYHTA